MTDVAASLFLLVQIFFVDLLLGADNAIVIAMACRRLPPEDARRAVFLGAGGAIALRLVMILFANALLGVPLVKLAGAWMLIVIALNVRVQDGAVGERAGRQAGASDFLSAAVVIMFADAAMSLDNVVALAAIAGGNLWLLAIGVLLSIPILVYGAYVLSGLLRLAPEVFVIGAAFLGWIAGGMAVTDPLVSGWIDANAPALGVFAPALGALFVLAAGGAARTRAAPTTTTPSPLRPAARIALAPSPPSAAVARLRSQEGLAPLGLPERREAAQPRVEPRLPRAEAEPAAEILPPDDAMPGFAAEPAAASGSGWTEERLVVAGFVLLAFLAGLIIFIASFFDSLT
jgi:YjbE family integral membrane protein